MARYSFAISHVSDQPTAASSLKPLEPSHGRTSRRYTWGYRRRTPDQKRRHKRGQQPKNEGEERREERGEGGEEERNGEQGMR
jgi:hypothetical protein